MFNFIEYSQNRAIENASLSYHQDFMVTSKIKLSISTQISPLMYAMIGRPELDRITVKDKHFCADNF